MVGLMPAARIGTRIVVYTLGLSIEINRQRRENGRKVHAG